MIEEREQTPIEEMTLEEAQAEFEDLRDRIMEIDAQLGARLSERVNPSREVRDAYWEWRGRAVAAKNYMAADLQAVKSRIKFLNSERNRLHREEMVEARRVKAGGLDEHSVESIIFHLRHAVHRVLDEHGIEPDDYTKITLAAASRYLDGKPPRGASREAREEAR